MANITIYHNPRCAKSREALKLIQAAGIEPEVIEYLKNPPSPKEMDRLLKRLGMEPQDLMRTKEKEYKDLGLADRKLTRHEAIRILVNHPKLIERPIVVKGTRAVLARPPEKVNELL